MSIFCCGCTSCTVQQFLRPKPLAFVSSWYFYTNLFTKTSRITEATKVAISFQSRLSVFFLTDAISCLISWRNSLISVRKALRSVSNLSIAFSLWRTFSLILDVQVFKISAWNHGFPLIAPPLKRIERLWNPYSVITHQHYQNDFSRLSAKTWESSNSRHFHICIVHSYCDLRIR